MRASLGVRELPPVAGEAKAETVAKLKAVTRPTPRKVLPAQARRPTGGRIRITSTTGRYSRPVAHWQGENRSNAVESEGAGIAIPVAART